jgi:hypothetical protein
MTNGIYYILELLVTKMSTLEVELAVHHVLSLILFVPSYFEPQSYSVMYLLPFLGHQFYYIAISPISRYFGAHGLSDFFGPLVGTRGESSHLILVLYNAVLLMTGMTFLYQSHSSNGRKIGKVVPSMAIGLVYVNYAGYCSHSMDDMCSLFRATMSYTEFHGWQTFYHAIVLATVLNVYMFFHKSLPYFK